MYIFILMPLLYIYKKRKIGNIYIYFQVFLLSILSNIILSFSYSYPYEFITHYLIYLSLSYAYITDILDHRIENNIIIFMLLYKFFTLSIRGVDLIEIINIFLSLIFFIILCILAIKINFGMGDVKLIFALSLLVGFSNILIILLYAFLISGLYGILSVMFKYNKWGTEIPFAPFIYLGYIILIVLYN